jgi:CRISPR-associated protein Csd2
MRNRIDFMALIEFTDSGMRGDPDADNAPTIDPETGQALITDTYTKRRIRDAMNLLKGDESGYRIYITNRAVLANPKAEAYASLGIAPVESAEEPEAAEVTTDSDSAPTGKKSKKPSRKATDYTDRVLPAQAIMTRDFVDIRIFGAVLSSKGPDCGQVRGPVQLMFGRSIDPVYVHRHSITRIAVETMQESENMGGINHTMGSKYTVPYALCAVRGFVSPHRFASTGFTESDLQLFWKALWNCWEFDRSASRGIISTRKIIAFEHDSPLGSARAADLFDLVSITRKDPSRVARAFKDYEIKIGELPKGVNLIEV